MSRSVSIFLDLLRFSAAVVVVVGHLTQSPFNAVFPDETAYAVAAVAVFFVLSGFVISFVVSRREDCALNYAVARISRLYSVLVPATVVSSLVLLLALGIGQNFLARNTAALSLGVLGWPHPLLRITGRTLLPLTFLNAFHNSLNDTFPPLDSPIWSLGYEVAYYLLFGITVFSRGVWRVGLFVLCAGLVGPSALRLFPVWLAGVVLQRGLSHLRAGARGKRLVGLLCGGLAGAMIWAWRPYMAWRASGRPGIWQALLRGTGRAGPADMYYYCGVATLLAIACVFFLEDLLQPVLLRVERPVRWCANHTFSLYLFHLPVLVLLAITTHYNRSSRVAIALVFAADVVLCMLLSSVSEDRKLWWRGTVGAALGYLAKRVHRRGMVHAEQPVTVRSS